MTIILVLTQDEFYDQAMSKLVVSDTFKTYKPLLSPMTRIAAVLFVRKFKSLYKFFKSNPDRASFFRLLKKIKPSDTSLESLPYIMGGIMTFSGADGRVIPSLFTIYKQTVFGYLALTNRNQLISCSFALFATLAVIFPYKNRDAMISVMALLVQIAHRETNYNFDNLEDDIIEIFGASTSAYTLMFK